MDWVGGNNPLLQPYHYAFLIQLRHIERDQSLGEIIKAQHNKLNVRRIQPSNLQAILEGETEEHVLLLIDGYDEYKKGKNQDIDNIIKNDVGNCYIIITSRPGSHLDDIRRFMSGEVKITGLSIENIKKCAKHFLGSEEMSEAMLEQCGPIIYYFKKDNSSLWNLLKIPILLLMVCMIYKKNKSLPASKTQIIEKMIQLSISRTTLKTLQKKCEEIEELEDLLHLLGKLAWEALQKDSMELLIKQVRNLTT